MRDEDLYSIVGFYTNSPASSNRTVFGGFFVRDFTGNINGSLVDSDEVSTITGTLLNDNLEYLKQYLAGKQARVGYVLRRRESGLWVGGWATESARGNAICRINRDFENNLLREDVSRDRQREPLLDADEIRSGISKEDSWEDFVADMVRDGRLKPVR